MKNIHPLLALPLLLQLAGCPATGSALESQGQAWAELRASLEDPLVTQAELDARLDALKESTQAVKEGVQEDLEGLTGDPLTDSALITGIGGALLWWLRQRTRPVEIAKAVAASKTEA